MTVNTLIFLIVARFRPAPLLSLMHRVRAAADLSNDRPVDYFFHQHIAIMRLLLLLSVVALLIPTPAAAQNTTTTLATTADGEVGTCGNKDRGNGVCADGRCCSEVRKRRKAARCLGQISGSRRGIVNSLHRHFYNFV